MKHNKAMMKTAVIWSKESYCKRKQVGCVVAKDNDPLAVGFNGTISGLPNKCEDIVPFESKGQLEKWKIESSHLVENCDECAKTGYYGGYSATSPYFPCSTCKGFGVLRNTDKTNDYTLHAEFNAITRAAKHADLKGASIYITLAPCKECAKLIAAHKIKHVYYKEEYKPEGIALLKKAKIHVEKLDC